MKRRVIKHSNLPDKLPIVGTIAFYLLLDRLNAPGFVWGAFGLLFLIIWVGVIVNIIRNESVDIFDKVGR